MMGGAGLAEPERAGTREEPEDPEDAARVRGPAWPAAAERPAPRDQPAVDPETPVDPAPPAAPVVPADPLPDRGGRSSGGATRSLLAASGTFLLRVLPMALTPLTTRRPPELASPSPSAGGGASGRNLEA
jgi:hypothetical protein